jgi:hypothetical protein
MAKGYSRGEHGDSPETGSRTQLGMLVDVLKLSRHSTCRDLAGDDGSKPSTTNMGKTMRTGDTTVMGISTDYNHGLSRIGLRVTQGGSRESGLRGDLGPSLRLTLESYLGFFLMVTISKRISETTLG